MKEAYAHRGTSFMQIFQNCNIFNDGAFVSIRDKGLREDNLLLLRQGEPLVFGKNQDRGIRLSGCNQPEVVELGNGVTEEDLLRHDETGPIGYAAMLAEMQPPRWPMPMGVIRRVPAPSFNDAMNEQIAEVIADRGVGDLQEVLYGRNTWKVE
jgi:2-oxoglutarate ferredoxin oxidoreductase subunit beta